MQAWKYVRAKHKCMSVEDQEEAMSGEVGNIFAKQAFSHFGGKTTKFSEQI